MASIVRSFWTWSFWAIISFHHIDWSGPNICHEIEEGSPGCCFRGSGRDTFATLQLSSTQVSQGSRAHSNLPLGFSRPYCLTQQHTLFSEKIKCVLFCFYQLTYFVQQLWRWASSEKVNNNNNKKDAFKRNILCLGLRWFLQVEGRTVSCLKWRLRD